MWCNWWIVFTLLYLCYGSCWHGAECLWDAVGGRDCPRTSSPPRNRRGSAVTRSTAGRKRLKHEWMPFNCANPLWNHLSCFLNVKWADHCEACYTTHTYLFHCPGHTVCVMSVALWSEVEQQRWNRIIVTLDLMCLCSFIPSWLCLRVTLFLSFSSWVTLEFLNIFPQAPLTHTVHMREMHHNKLCKMSFRNRWDTEMR